MDGIQLFLEGIKAFEALKPGLEGLLSAGTVIASTAKGSVYVAQKGARFVSFLIKSKKGKSTTKTKKPAKTSKDDLKITKDDIAIVVDISRRALVDVAGYLEKQKIDADIVMVTNDPAYGDQVIFLNPESEKEWNEIVLEFKTLMNKIKRTAGGKRAHIFLAAPLPLVFAMGAVWGTVDDAAVYHWEKNTYHRVVNISRKLR